MVLNEKEVNNFVELFKSNSYGKISPSVVQKMVDAALSTRSRDDEEILRNMIIVAKQARASKDAVTTVLAQTVDEREKIMSGLTTKSNYDQVIEFQQVLYGPGHVSELHEVIITPEDEVREMVVDNMQILYGPGPVQSPKRGIKR